MRRRILCRDHTGTSGHTVLVDGWVIFDLTTDHIRVGDDKTVGGIALDVHAPMTSEQFAFLLEALRYPQPPSSGFGPRRAVGIPIDYNGLSAATLLPVAEIVMDGPDLRLGDGKAIGGIRIRNPNMEVADVAA